VIEVAGLCKRYRGADAAALDAIDLRVPAGALFGLLGPNGAGKTTFMSILTGLLAKDAGTVRIGGIDLDRDRRALRRLIGYVPQALAFYPTLTVRENLKLFSALSANSDPRQIEASIDIAGLGAHLGKLAQALSGGLQRRLNLAIGLLGQPRLLCLDEPTAGVDPQSRHFLIESVKHLCAQGMTVLYSTHYMEEIERACDRIAILDRGRIIAQGAIGELLQPQDRNLEALFLRLTDTALRDG